VTPEEIRAALDTCRLGQKEFANVWTAYDQRTVRRWCAGEAVMPAEEAEWLRGLAEWHRAHPYPKYRPQGRKE
jgi:DNA-binding transcriptional regulator YiaG